jgi:acyl carrier protein
MSAPMDRDTFIARTVEWINGTLVRSAVTVDADTPLFASGLIDSIRVLQLIAWTEHALGIRIPDLRIRMDHFRTVRHIADAFATTGAVSRDDDAAA